jgi:hypothetical protein
MFEERQGPRVDPVDRRQDGSALPAERPADGGEPLVAQNSWAEAFAGDPLGDDARAEPVAGLEHRAHLGRRDSGGDGRLHDARVLRGGEPWGEAGQRIRDRAGADVGRLQDEGFPAVADLGIECPGGFCRAAGQPGEPGEASRRTDVAGDRILKPAGKVRVRCQVADRAVPPINPNRWPATFRIWISSEPSVMR